MFIISFMQTAEVLYLTILLTIRLKMRNTTKWAKILIFSTCPNPKSLPFLLYMFIANSCVSFVRKCFRDKLPLQASWKRKPTRGN